VIIQGGNQITLSGGNATRLFFVSSSPAYLRLENIILTKGFSSTEDGGAIYNLGTLELTGVTLLDNKVDTLHSGGAIINYGPLTINNSLFELNQGGNGGALFLRFPNGYAVISNSTFRGNNTTSETEGWGGAILLWDGAAVTLHASRLEGNQAVSGGAINNRFANSSITIDQNSVLQGNSATDSGGAIYTLGSSTLNNSTFTLNTAYDGGGIYNGGSSGILQGFGLTFSQNSAGFFGGAIDNFADLFISGSTFVQNSASHGGVIGNSDNAFISSSTLSGNSAVLTGGALHNTGTLTLLNSTFFGNSAPLGATFALYSNPISSKNVLIGRNSGSSYVNCYLVLGSVNSLGFNIADDASCGLAGSGDQVVTDLKLSPLANFGGQTLTHLPRPGSPAIDNGTGIGAPSIDQRGLPRLAGLAVDVGAVEVQPNDWKFIFLPLVKR
jgi:predicted outer membrane repeat protein